MTQFGGAGGSFGPNAWLVDDMYDRFLADPSSVSDSWREFFADYRPAPVPAPVPRPPRRRPTAQAAVPAAAAPAPAQVGEAGDEQATVLRGAASRIVANMEASLAVPTATSVRTVPARLLEVNRLDPQQPAGAARRGPRSASPTSSATPSCGPCATCPR